MIICAAIKLIDLDQNNSIIICGHRHGNCFEMIKHLEDKWRYTPIRNIIQGFINHKGEFLDRKEAFEHVKEIGQCNATQRYYWEDHNQDELYSEDLY